MKFASMSELSGMTKQISTILQTNKLHAHVETVSFCFKLVQSVCNLSILFLKFQKIINSMHKKILVLLLCYCRGGTKL